MAEPFTDVIDVDLDDFFETISEEARAEIEELTIPQLELYKDKGPAETSPQLAAISFRHHRMAQLVALGYPMTKVADMLGCTIQTVSRLCRDPSFKILVEAELEKLQSRDHALQIKMQEVAEVGLDELHDMLVNEETKVKPQLVKDITMDLLDRSGHGPSKQVAVTKSFGIEAGTLERIKENARPARRLPALEQAPTCEASGPETPMGDTDGMPLREATPTEGETGPGTCLPAEILEIAGEEGA
jgi:hypothetical protein